MRYEIEDIKVIIRGKFVGRAKEEIEEMLAFKNPLNTVDYDYLLSATSAEEVIERLKDTPYYKHTKYFQSKISHEGLFRLENNLDFTYYIILRKFIMKSRTLITRLRSILALHFRTILEVLKFVISIVRFALERKTLLLF